MKSELAQNIESLSSNEKLQLMELLWDSLSENPEDIPVPEWQKKELEKRYQEYKKGSTKLYDWKEVHQELRTR